VGGDRGEGKKVIIKCEKCKTRYSFNESLIEGKGIRVRCTSCQNVFFQETPSAEITLPADIVEPEEEKKEVEDLAKTLKKLGIDSDDHASDRWEAEAFPPADDEHELDDIPQKGEGKIKKKRAVILSGIIVCFLLIIIAGSVYLWFFPRERTELFDKVKTYIPIEKFLDMKKSKKGVEVIEEGINFSEVKERIVKNWIIGDLLIVEGAAINNNKFQVTKIKVRGQLLDSEGKVLAQKESFCSNILTDEELRNLTEKEIYKELGNPREKNLANENIPPQGKAPFMIVFTNPTKEAGEFIVELADIKTVDK